VALLVLHLVRLVSHDDAGASQQAMPHLLQGREQQQQQQCGTQDRFIKYVTSEAQHTRECCVMP
jgi:hypothetical protein